MPRSRSKPEMFGTAVSFRGMHVKRLATYVFTFLLASYVLRYIWEWKSSSRFQTELVLKNENMILGKGRGDFNPNSLTKGTSLTFRKTQFILGGKPLTILSGAMHYFRVFPEHWRDRMLKMKACGLNTIETYVSWNLHEPAPGRFDFDGILDVRRYIQLARTMGLYVILRPGPYICSEWDFGGMPSWLLADPNMKVRSNYPGYRKAAERFLNALLPLITDLQYCEGGPIIAVQVENEFGSYSTEVSHLTVLKQIMRLNGITELLVTSDNESGMKKAPFHHEALPMPNFQAVDRFDKIIRHVHDLDPTFPLMVMEYWSGWFDHWGDEHQVVSVDQFARNLKGIFMKNSSVNFYMFHGGTNFGFMAGANFFDTYKPDVTSYDYDALLDEAGNITPKYKKARELILEYVLKPNGITSLPEPPPNSPKAAYGHIFIEGSLPWEIMMSLMEEKVVVESPVPMEMLKLVTGVGQDYGYIVYRITIAGGVDLTLPGHVRDRAQILVDSNELAVIDCTKENPTVTLSIKMAAVLDIVVENLGRVNYATMDSPMFNQQRKGLNGDVFLDGNKLESWTVFPLSFTESYLKRLSRSTHWKKQVPEMRSPSMYKANLFVSGDPQDTYLNMKGWSKGVVFINGFNLGRYWDIGPQRTLFVPGPVLSTGNNEILIFEQHTPAEEISFQDTAILG